MQATAVRDASGRDRRVEGGGSVDGDDQAPRGGVQCVRRVPRGSRPGGPDRSGLPRFHRRAVRVKARGSARADEFQTGSARTPAVAPADGDLGWGFSWVGQPTTPPVERCPARFRAARDEYPSRCAGGGGTPKPPSWRSSAPRTSSSPTWRRSVGKPSSRRRPGTWPGSGPGVSGGGTPRRRPGCCVRRWLTSWATCTRSGRSGKTWPTAPAAALSATGPVGPAPVDGG